MNSFPLICCILLFSSIGSGLYSQPVASNCPASPYPVEVMQPDGSKLMVVGKGNRAFHYATTIDGYTIVKNEQGIYEYADASGRKALNPGYRSNAEVDFLHSIDRGIIPPSFQQAARYKSDSDNTFQPDTSESYAFPLNGTQKVLVLLIEYPDMEATYTQSDFDNLLNQANYNGTGSFKDYFDQVSRGQLTLDSDVFGWYTAAKNHTNYGNDQGINATRELVGEAIDAAEAAGVDFSQYDNDQDGYLDGLVVVHSGPGAEQGSQTQYIWSHHSYLGSFNNRSYDG